MEQDNPFYYTKSEYDAKQICNRMSTEEICKNLEKLYYDQSDNADVVRSSCLHVLYDRIDRMTNDGLVVFCKKMYIEKNAPAVNLFERKLRERLEKMSIDEIAYFFEKTSINEHIYYLFSQELSNRAESLYKDELNYIIKNMQNRGNVNTLKIFERALRKRCELYG